jgi:hypothetical protein
MKIREFLNQDNWCRFHLAKRSEIHAYRGKDRQGNDFEILKTIMVPCSPLNGSAEKFCLLGAAQKVYERTSQKKVSEKLKTAILQHAGITVTNPLRGVMRTGPSISEWQDQAEWSDVEAVLEMADV